MRVTKEALIKIAGETVERYRRKDRSIAAAYLCGSLLGEDYQLGGAADIDLVFIHSENPQTEREVIPLSEDIHLDIAHHPQDDYHNGKQIRLHPWLGPTLNTAMVLHDPRHLLDFIQASVRGQFDRADYVYERAQRQLGQARKIWSSYHPFGGNPEIGDPIQFVYSYVRALGLTANAVASLSGPPLTERRLLLEYKHKTEAAGKPGLYPGMLGLLGWPNLHQADIQTLIEKWKEIYHQVPGQTAPLRLHACRQSYYLSAFQAMLALQRTEAILWPMMRTIALAMNTQSGNPTLMDSCQALISRLGLGRDALQDRLIALDAYLDMIEETLEDWAQANGVLSI